MCTGVEIIFVHELLLLIQCFVLRVERLLVQNGRFPLRLPLKKSVSASNHAMSRGLSSSTMVLRKLSSCRDGLSKGEHARGYGPRSWKINHSNWLLKLISDYFIQIMRKQNVWL